MKERLCEIEQNKLHMMLQPPKDNKNNIDKKKKKIW